MNQVEPTKKCGKCQIIQSIENFGRDKTRIDGYQCYCKKCKKEHDKNDHQKHKINRNQKNRHYAATHKDGDSMRHRKMRQFHPEKLREQRRKFLLKYPNYKKDYIRNRRHTDPTFNLISLCRCRVYSCFKGATRPQTKELIGCSGLEFRKYIEAQFTDGMSWLNQGKYGWHLDHIIPVSFFNQNDHTEQKICWHYSNMRPLWATDNLKKNNTVLNVNLNNSTKMIQ